MKRMRLLLWLCVLVTTTAEKRSSSQSGTRKLLLNQPYPRQYTILDYATLNSRILTLASTYPDWIKLTTSQEAYGLPRAGSEDDCPSDEGGEGCLNYILTVQDFTTYPEGSEGSNKLPEVFWSGALHGNERVGPTAVTEAVHLLVEAAHCESLPSPAASSTYATEFREAVDCRNTFQEHGISDFQRQWLARLVRTRRLVVMPTPNSLGYSRNERTEGDMDVNRDFPFDNVSPQDCMQTIAARSINEVFREHMFQLALTFHAGMEVIGYEWGAPTYVNATSPDEEAQQQIAQAYSKFADAFDTVPSYQYGDMNTMVYSVRGGMEDWAYAASWDTDRVLPCEPTTFGGYPREKTIYNDSMLRVYNMLIETSNHVTPEKSTLGTTESVLSSSTPGNGHVSRNIRLALLALELVEPYVHIVGVDSRSLQDSVFVRHQEGSDASSCFGPSIKVSSSVGSLSIEWSVGGALEVAETSLYAFNSADFEDFDCSASQMPSPDLSKASIVVAPASSSNGTSQWHRDGVSPTRAGEEADVGPVFRSTLDVSGVTPGDRLVVVAVARVDPSWSVPQDSAKPSGLEPQAHIVQARSNNDWHHESSGKVIDGREQWFSRPTLLTVEEEPQDDGWIDPSETIDLIVEETNRFDRSRPPSPSVLAAPPMSASVPSVAPIEGTLIPSQLRASGQPSTDLMAGPGLPSVTDNGSVSALPTSMLPSTPANEDKLYFGPTEQAPVQPESSSPSVGLLWGTQPTARPLKSEAPTEEALLQPPGESLTATVDSEDTVPSLEPLDDGAGTTQESRPQSIPEWNDDDSLPTLSPAPNNEPDITPSESYSPRPHRTFVAFVVLGATGTLLACIALVRRREMAYQRHVQDEEAPEEELNFDENNWSFSGVFDSSWYSVNSGRLSPDGFAS